MKNKLIRSAGEKDVLLGNEAFALGAIEADVKVVAAYPGTPSSEIVEVLLDHAEHFGYYAEWSINEKVAFELAAGASLTNVRSLSVMKGAGLNVIMDMFMTLPYTGIKGGFVIIVADDPGAHYSSNEQDSRLAAQWAKIPCLEPEDQQEAKRMTKTAFSLSEALELPVMVRSVTRLSHSSGVVEFGSAAQMDHKASFNKHYKLPYRWNVYGPPGAVAKHEWQEKQILQVKEKANQSDLNTLFIGTTKIGVVAAGIGAAYTREAVRKIGKNKELWQLKCGWVYPLPETKCLEILKNCDRVLVVEDGDPFIESQLRILAQKHQLTTEICGKMFESYLPTCNELDSDVVKNGLLKFLNLPNPTDESKKKIKEEINNLISPRSSTLCAGCSHLGTYWALMQETQRGKEAIPLINGDIGCYEQAGYGIKGQNPEPNDDLSRRYTTRTPYNFLDTLYVMGSGISMAQGQTRAGYDEGDVIAVAGDSTFFHTCMPGLLNATWNGTKVTFIVMDNSWTSMTGHQVCPATGLDPRGLISKKILIEDIARSMGVEFVRVINPYDVSAMQQAVREAIDFSGPAVVVARGECMLQILRRQGRKSVRTYVTEECIGCKICLQIGCPAINFQDKRANIDTLLCVDCGLCVQVCPHDAIVEGK